ncbi:hypothetical protein QVD17_37364 [Tagetes erecta]|uniref:Uncharacterized protein n=1 Tax=Tagetes erecta TaxID=13708 RepID=A0AAD8NJZ4_TARER|nr:hypothetical protein QVD17_37364 [Tagetes erecta]
MEGCEHKCGDVRIPFPFGIGANCSMNKWYVVDCISSTPYLHALNHLEILGVDLENQTVTVNTPVISDCSETKSIDLGRSPFYFSKLQNIFVHEGCGNAVMTDHGRSITGCSTTCGNDSVSHTNNCLGMGCCQATLPHHLKSYNINITDGVSNRACKSAFLVDEASYLEGKFSIGENKSYVPISLLWTLAFSDLETLICYAFLDKLEVDLGNGTTVDSWKCRYSIPSNMEGNAYLIDGCESRFDSEECLRCKDAGGFCYNVPIYGVDGLVAEKKERCCSSWSKVKVDVGNDTLVESLKCLEVEYGKVDVNAYLADGFEEECATCRDGTGGSCSYDLIYDVQGLVTRKVFSCIPGQSKVHESKSSQAVILGVSVSIGILVLVATIYLMHKEIKKTKERIQRKMSSMEEGNVLPIFDSMVVKEGSKDVLLALANLAMRCLNMNGKYRPTMMEVVSELETIRTSHIPSTD